MINELKSEIFQSLNGDGFIQSVSEEWLSFSGYTREEVIGKHFTKFLTQESYACVQKNFPILKEYGKVNNVALNFLLANGTAIEIVLNGTSFYNEDGAFSHTSCELKTLNFYIKSKTHIQKLLDESHNLNEKLLLSQKQLEEEKIKAQEAAKHKSQFLANMSHEIRTPMNAILGFVDLLAQNEQDTKRIEQFNIIKNSGQTLLHIINDILDLSKLHNQKLSIEPISFNPTEVFKNSILLYEPFAQEKTIHLNYHIDENIPHYLVGDDVRLKQVLSNFMSNALKFTHEDGNVDVFVKYENAKLEVSVKDEGIGIKKENLDHIFNVFEQEDKSVTRNYGGTGLGLAISKELIEMMNGTLNVTSTLGVGSEFTFSVPLEISEIEVDDEQEELGDRKLSGTILLVEDNRSNQLLMSILLEELGFDVEIANDGLEAFDMFKKTATQHRYCIVLMDENMPNMNGIKSCQAIRDYESKQDIKASTVIAVTANALGSDRKRFLDAGMDDYLAKPIDKLELKRILIKYS